MADQAADARQDLEATKASIRRDAADLTEIEDLKAPLDPGDSDMVDLSEDAERVAARLRDKTAAERQLAEEIQAAE
jgi:hypothetical protein